VLARGQAGQSAGAGALLPRGGRWRIAFSLPARQRLIDLDAHAPVCRLCVAFTGLAGKTCARTFLELCGTDLQLCPQLISQTERAPSWSPDILKTHRLPDGVSPGSIPQ